MTQPAYMPTQPSKAAWPATVGPKWSKRVMPWLEEFWHSKKRFPSDSELVQRFGWNETQLLQFHHSKYMRNTLKRYGIVHPEQVDFTPEQVAAISLITNFSDTRTTEAKMAAIGVTPVQLHGWMRDPKFQQELAARADEVTDNLFPEAQAALARHIKKGNFPALKFYYELTGRAQSPELTNLKQTVMQLVEVIERRVKDPELLSAIAEDFNSILNPQATKTVQPTAVAELSLAQKYEQFQTSQQEI